MTWTDHVTGDWESASDPVPCVGQTETQPRFAVERRLLPFPIWPPLFLVGPSPLLDRVSPRPCC